MSKSSSNYYDKEYMALLHALSNEKLEDIELEILHTQLPHQNSRWPFRRIILLSTLAFTALWLMISRGLLQSQENSSSEPLNLCKYESNCPQMFGGENQVPATYMTAASYDLAGCFIPKSMSTTMLGVMCYLHNPFAFMKSNRSIYREYWGSSLCEHRNEIMKENNTVIPYEGKFSIVREPISRFVSGFVDRCLTVKEKCNGCYTDLECFVKKEYESLMKLSRTSKKPRDRLAFHHFAPQHWYCDFKDDLSNMTIFKYGDSIEDSKQLADDLEIYLAKHGVTGRPLVAVSQVIRGGGNLKHSTHNSSESDTVRKKLESNPELMKMVVKMYYYDFVLFGFTFPKFQLH